MLSLHSEPYCDNYRVLVKTDDQRQGLLEYVAEIKYTKSQLETQQQYLHYTIHMAIIMVYLDHVAC